MYEWLSKFKGNITCTSTKPCVTWLRSSFQLSLTIASDFVADKSRTMESSQSTVRYVYPTTSYMEPCVQDHQEKRSRPARGHSQPASDHRLLPRGWDATQAECMLRTCLISVNGCKFPEQNDGCDGVASRWADIWLMSVVTAITSYVSSAAPPL